MNEHLKARIARAIDDLPDERGYQVLDYVDFLASKYAERTAPTNVFAKLTDKVEDVMRAGKMPLDAISGTVSFFDGASKVMKGLAPAAQAVVDEAAKTAQTVITPATSTTPKSVSPEPAVATSQDTGTPAPRPDGNGS